MAPWRVSASITILPVTIATAVFRATSKRSTKKEVTRTFLAETLVIVY